jgi:5-methyltetrahydrofolate--homocysteine methyltransferase
MNQLKKILNKRILLLDGATGTNLLSKGLVPGESPSALNLRNSQAVYDLQRAYVDAGSDIILTNTFGADPLHFKVSELEKLIIEGVKLAKRAAGNKAIVWGDVTTLGELIKPYGVLDFDEARRNFYIIFRMLYKAGIRTFFIETFTSIIEAKAAFLAARNFSKDIYVSLSLEESGRTLMGDVPESIAVTFDALGAQGIGINCTLPEVAIDGVARMVRVTECPLIIKPNAGRIEIVGTKVHHTISDARMAKYSAKFVKSGANMIGGCCGTTPLFIKYIAKHKRIPKPRQAAKVFMLASPSKVLKVDQESTVVVGERLNPSGRKKVKNRLKHKDYSIYAEESRIQEKAGADALDINAFVIDLDEREVLKYAVYEVIKNTALPLFIDTQNHKAAEAILVFYPGVGVYNSIPARPRELRKWLPLVKKYGFKAVISLVGRRIPRNIEERLKNVRLALKLAQEIDFPKKDLIFDPLVFSAATERDQIDYTLETVSWLNKKGLKSILGISNVSFGLPDRSRLNATLAAAAVKQGITFIILNPLDDTVMLSINAAEMLFREKKIVARAPIDTVNIKKTLDHKISKRNLTKAIVHGDERLSYHCARVLLESGIPAQQIIDQYISRALKQVGDYYEGGKFFIPDLLKSADASKKVLTIVKKYLPVGKKKGTIVLATVKGDIHDIGKNIACMVFESAGYEVIDLGKDVSVDKIVNAVIKYNPDALGLSALLTTTMPEMEHVTHRLKKEKLSVRVIIGGPNVSRGYAKKIGAYGAAKNVLEGLKLLKTNK